MASAPTNQASCVVTDAVTAVLGDMECCGGGGVEGQGHFGHHRSLISVKLGPVLHKYFGPCYNVIREKPNDGFPFQRSPTLTVPFFE
jgi:hypothetical protein